MPLNLVKLNVEYVIQKICGQDKIRHHLEVLGITEGSKIMVLSKFAEYYVVLIKGSKLGLDRQLVQKIIIRAEE
ncbi:MAG: FeoA family protein [Lachnospiraceae bacterium]|nr:FeoA family protein [Lachnospiraceae bacterium]